MPRSRSHSTSSLPGNLMASWSIHSYPAPRVEATVEDPVPDTIDSGVEQMAHEQPNEEIIPPAEPASDTMELMPGSMQLSPQYTISSVFVGSTVSHDVQLPSFADPQRSLTIPTMSPPSYMNHFPPAQLSSPVSDSYSVSDEPPDYVDVFQSMFDYWLSEPRARRCVSFQFLFHPANRPCFSFSKLSLYLFSLPEC